MSGRLFELCMDCFMKALVLTFLFSLRTLVLFLSQSAPRTRQVRGDLVKIYKLVL